jgi:sulfur-oxidizing protein SoxB
MVSRAGRCCVRWGRSGAGLTLGPTLAMGALGDANAARTRRQPCRPQGKAQKFTILHTSDIHAQLHTHDEFFLENGKPVYKKRGGYGVLKTMIDTLRNEDPDNTIVIDGGDCFQGGGVAAKSEGRAIVPLMNAVGYDLILPGNWEVVYGKENMLKDLGGYRADKICANMYHEKLADFCGDSVDPNADLAGEMIFQPYWTRNIAGIKIGFIGYNDPLTPKRQSPAYSCGIKFTKPETNVAKYIRILRDYEQCAMVFLVTHMGLAQQVDLANKPEVEGADLILGADTHERVRKPIEGKYSKVTEPGAFGSFVARLDVVVEDGKVKDSHYELLDVDPEKYPADKGMLAAGGRGERALQGGVEQSGRQHQEHLSALLRDREPDGQPDHGRHHVEAEARCGHQQRLPILPADRGRRKDPHPDHQRPPLEHDPVDSDAKYGEATGQQLWDWLEKELHNVFAKDPAKRFGGWVVRFKGMTANFTMHNDLGKRVNWIKVGKKPIDLQKSYLIAACEREGDPDDTLCRLEKVKNPRLANATMHNILREYFAEFSPVAPKVEGRITATDAKQTLLSQLEGYDYEFRTP